MPLRCLWERSQRRLLRPLGAALAGGFDGGRREFLDAERPGIRERALERLPSRWLTLLLQETTDGVRNEELRVDRLLVKLLTDGERCPDWRLDALKELCR